MELTHIDLFSGIGGFALACSWAGIETGVFCEKDEGCRGFLERTYPDIPIIHDIKYFTVDTLVNVKYNRLSSERKEIVDMGVKNSKYDTAVELYGKGLSIQDIADFYGTTRQAMWMILKRRGCEFRDQLKYGKENHFYRGGPLASGRVHDLIERAVEKGLLIRPDHCEKCGKGSVTIESHHSDYNKPLDVNWFCKPCHFEWHENNRAIEQIIDFPPMDRQEIARRGGQRKEVTPDELQQEIEEATRTFILTAGVP
ncbi:MAG: DNA cytosine methyltransferase [Pseudomonadota bacterium]